jgi:uncharacterized membrane protein
VSRTLIGTFIGLILGLVWVFASFGSMVLVGLLTLIGALIGKLVNFDDLRQQIINFLSN